MPLCPDDAISCVKVCTERLFQSSQHRKICLNHCHRWTRIIIIIFCQRILWCAETHKYPRGYLSLSFLPWLYFGFVSTLLFFAGRWEQFAVADTTIWENCVSKQQWLGSEKILQSCLLATFCNCSTKSHCSSGSRPVCLFVLLIHKALMHFWTLMSLIMCLPLEMLMKELEMEKYCVFLIWICSSLTPRETLSLMLLSCFLGNKPSYE